MSKKLGQVRRALKAKQKFGAIGLTRSRLAADLKNSYRHGRVVSSGNKQRLVKGPDAELRGIVSKSKDVAKRQTKYAKVKQSRDANKTKIILKRKKELVTRHVKKNKVNRIKTNICRTESNTNTNDIISHSLEQKQMGKTQPIEEL